MDDRPDLLASVGIIEEKGDAAVEKWQQASGG